MEYCSTKQISTFVLALIGFSILVFFIEEYTEESEMQSEMEMKKAFYNKEHSNGGITGGTAQKATEYPAEECWKHEQFEVVTQCAPCKDFEIKAIKAAHCLKTGYFDRVTCSKSATTVLRPCASPKESRRKEFYLFTMINAFILVISYMIMIERKTQLDRAVYMRLPQHF
ncbi:CBN-JTR-1 protein [Caenorhabditis brenneri]|uniref:Protein JTB n=1 Tax=Caenorhabditis brenneri TaxID=135651 RepID=G0NAC2_CAEBE|nr:CBN-JTR-1 protein [Caenorhabditis brenneri]